MNELVCKRCYQAPCECYNWTPKSVPSDLRLELLNNHELITLRNKIDSILAKRNTTVTYSNSIGSNNA